MLLHHLFFGLVFGFFTLINAAPFPDDGYDWEPLNITDFRRSNTPEMAAYDPSYSYHDYSTVQIWMGKVKVNLGNVIGSSLYGTIWNIIDTHCPVDNPGHECNGWSAEFGSKCAVGSAGNVEDCSIKVDRVSGHWENDQIRKLLIGAAAGAMEAVTLRDTKGGTNCFDMQGGYGKGCNVGDAVRVMFPYSVGPKDDPHRNTMTIMLSNPKSGYGEWDCCEGDKLELIDKKTDGLKDEIMKAFPQYTRRFRRDSRCIINGWDTCP